MLSFNAPTELVAVIVLILIAISLARFLLEGTDHVHPRDSALIKVPLFFVLISLTIATTILLWRLVVEG